MTIMDKDNNTTNGTLPIFEVPEKVNIIKVIGVGGGGGKQHQGQATRKFS